MIQRCPTCINEESPFFLHLRRKFSRFFPPAGSQLQKFAGCGVYIIEALAAGFVCMHELGNDQRFAEWVHAHGDTVRAFLFAMVRRRDVAEDLTQEVFCRAWVARDAYQEHGKILPYLLKIADRLVCDRGRRRPPDVSLDREQWKRYEPVSSAATPPEAAATAEQMAALNAALECLSPLQRRVLLLRYFGQMTFAEIAQVIGCPLNTTASHCRRGLEALRRLLGPDQ